MIQWVPDHIGTVSAMVKKLLGAILEHGFMLPQIRVPVKRETLSDLQSTLSTVQSFLLCPSGQL